MCAPRLCTDVDFSGSSSRSMLMLCYVMLENGWLCLLASALRFSESITRTADVALVEFLQLKES